MNQCHLCRSNAVEIFFEQPRYPMWGGAVVPPRHAREIKFEKLQIGICSNCGFIMLIPLAQGDFKNSLYDNFYSSSNPFVEDPETVIDLRTSQLLEFIEPILKTDRGKVLEIGAYDGQFLYQLKKRGWQVFGCEPNSIGQQAAQRYGMDIKQAYFKDGLYPKNSFDLIIARFVLEHVADPIGFLQAIWSALKPGGHVALDIPDGESRVLNRVLGSLVKEHISYFGSQTLKLALTKSDFIQIELLPYLGGIAAKARRGEIEGRGGGSILHPYLLQLLASTHNYTKDLTEKMNILRTNIEKLQREEKKIVIYGANTQSLDYLMTGAIRAEQIEYIVDDDPHKQGCYLVGTNRIVYPTTRLIEKPVQVVVVSAYFSQDKIITELRNKLESHVELVKFYPIPEVISSR